MAKQNIILNDQVSCFSYPYEAEFIPAVTVMKNSLGNIRQSFTHDDHDWMTYTINMDQLDATARDQLMNFVLAVGGNRDSFLFRDEFGYGYQVPRTTIGTKAGAGAEAFQMIRTKTVGAVSKSYDVWNIEDNATIQLWVATVLKTVAVDYVPTYVDSGSINVTCADTGTVEVSCDYLRRVRFTGSFRNILRAYEANTMSLSFAEEGVS